VAISLPERLLTLWAALAIIAGVALGHRFPELFLIADQLEIRQINLPVAVLLWLTIIPMLLRLDFGALPGVARHWPGSVITLLTSWIVKPLTMALLTWAFIGHWLTPWLPAAQIESYMAGMLILAAIPCLALVLAWSHLAQGEARFTAGCNALNAMIAVLVFAPMVGLLLWLTGALGLSAAAVPWRPLIVASALYLLAPLTIAASLRLLLVSLDKDGGLLRGALNILRPIGLLALLLTLVLLAGSQSNQILVAPLSIGLLAIPMLIQVPLVFAIAYLLNRWVGTPHAIAGPSALIGSSHFLALALGTTIVLFGLTSGAALTVVVWLLLEVPVLLLLVAVIRGTSGWFAQAKKPATRTEAEAEARGKAPKNRREESRSMSSALSPSPSQSLSPSPSLSPGQTQPTTLPSAPETAAEPARTARDAVDSASWVPGEVVADRLATLNAPIAGRILTCDVRAGDCVTPEQVLMQISFANGAATVALNAPWQSVVRHVHVPVEGSTVETGQPLVELIAVDGFVLRFAVPEADADTLRPGDRVKVHFNRRTLTEVELEILRAWPEIDPETRTRFFDARLPGDLNAYIGLGAAVRIAGPEKSAQLDAPQLPFGQGDKSLPQADQTAGS
jgi:ACR3 family arsenite transporter